MALRRPIAVVVLAVVFMAGGGCARLGTTTLGSLMVAAPKRVDPTIAYTNSQMAMRPTTLIDRRFWVPVCPDGQRLLVSIVEPRPHGTRPLATVIVLHGAYGRSESMMASAVGLSRHRFRAVLVDLPGHGFSTSAKLTYGVRESQELSLVVDALEAQRLLEGRLGVYGYSYGAATAVQFAAQDPRVDAVVALAPFASLRRAAADLARTRLPWGRVWMTPQRVEEMLQVAAQKGQFDVDRADTRLAIRQTTAPVLLVHGTADRVIRAENSLELHLSSGGTSQLTLIPGATHNDLIRDPNGTVASLATDWFERYLLSDSRIDPGAVAAR